MTQREHAYVLGVDIGTGSTKGVLVTAAGTVVATARRDHRMALPRAGRAEMDAEKDFWGDFLNVTRELVEASGSGDIVALTVSGLGPSVVRTDGSGKPRHPAILYGIDTRATKEIRAITDALGSAEILARCGKNLSSQAVGPKLLWLRNNHPEAWDPADHWHTAHSYVIEKLTGEWVLDHHTASQCDPLYDVMKQQWARDWTEEVLGEMALPRLAWPTEVAGKITSQASDLTGLPMGIPVMAGTIDAWAEAFSAGVRKPGDLMLMYGSTTFMIQMLPAPTVSPYLWTTSGVEPGSHTLAAGMATTGSLTSWIQELTGDAPFDALVEEARNVPAGSDGLVILPYFAGERSPIFDPHARGTIIGLTLRHTRAHLYRASYEGIAFGIRQIVDVLDATAGPPLRVRAVGGGTQGGLWTQIVSDVTGLEQQLPEQTIGASYGAALMAGIGSGFVPPQTDWSSVAGVVRPNPQHRDLYNTLYDVYTGLYPATMRFAHILARIDELH